MCGGSEATIVNDKYELSLGISGGLLSLNGDEIYEYSEVMKNIYGNRDLVKKKLMNLGASNLSDIILQWVENAEEY